LQFLADRTNGRTYATVLRPSVCRLSACNVCFVAKRYNLEQKLQLTAYRKSYLMRHRLVPKWMTLTFVRRSFKACQPLRHIRHWICRKLLEIQAWFQSTTNRKWPMEYGWSRDQWCHV